MYTEIGLIWISASVLFGWPYNKSSDSQRNGYEYKVNIML